MKTSSHEIDCETNQFMLKAVVSMIVILTLSGCQNQHILTDAMDGKDSATKTALGTVFDVENRKQNTADVQIGGVVRCVFRDSIGALWIGGEGDLIRKKGPNVTSFDLKDARGNGVTIKQIIEDANGVIWCGTGGGISRIDGDSFTSFGEQDGLISRDVWSIVADKKGTIWIGTIDGVCQFDGERFIEFPLPPSKPDPTRGITSENIVHCIAIDHADRVWFGTNGGAYILDGKNLSRLSEQDGLPNDVVYRITEDQSGNMWIGTTHNGICRYDGKAFTNFTADGLVEGEEIWCVHEDTSGNIWFSGKHFGVYQYDGHAFTKFGKEDGIDSPGMMSIADDADGRIWLGGVNGLFRQQGNGFIQVAAEGLTD